MAWIIIGHKRFTEAVGYVNIGRGAFQMRRRYGVSRVGACGKANVGISNDKECEMHSRRKTKVSRATLIGPGSVGT